MWHVDIYAQAIVLRYLSDEDDERPKNPQLGTTEEATDALAALVDAYPDSAGIAADLLEARAQEKGLSYDGVISILRSMIARVRSHELLAELAQMGV